MEEISGVWPNQYLAVIRFDIPAIYWVYFPINSQKAKLHEMNGMAILPGPLAVFGAF